MNLRPVVAAGVVAIVATTCAARPPATNARSGRAATSAISENEPHTPSVPAAADHSAARRAHTTAPDPKDRRLSNPVVPVAYQLELELDPRQPTYRGQVTIDIRIDVPTSSLWLHALELDIDTATVLMADSATPKPVALDVRKRPAAERVDLSTAKPLAAGKARLQLSFRGRFGDKVGIFRQASGGDYYAFTDFEPIDARRGFPCFDEPGFKTPWTVSLVIPAAMHGLSNMPAVASERLSDNRQRIQFAPTRPLPSYLVAAAVGPFDIVKGPAEPVPLRVIAPRGKAAWAQRAVATAGPLLAIVRDYFATPVPFPKLDLVSVPQFNGAMENPGLITVASHILLVDPKGASIPQLRLLALVCAHEFAHLWFGDLVTPADWNDLWLNEGFATWLADKALMAWRPDRQPLVDQVAAKHEAMAADEHLGARAMRQPVHKRADIRAVFDVLTYKKGGALVAMWEAWLSEDGFRRSMQTYVRTHADRSVTTETLVATVNQVAGRGDKTPITSFLHQPGVPLVQMDLMCKPGRVSVALAQERYLTLAERAPAQRQTKNKTQPRWDVPVCLRYDAGDNTAGHTCTLLTESHSRIDLDTQRCPTWLIPNADARGYYRYHLQDLAPLLRAPLTAREATDVAHNLRALLYSGHLPADKALEAVVAVGQHPNRLAVEALIAVLKDVGDHLVQPAQVERFRAYVRGLFSARARALGFASKPGESEEDTLLRPGLLEFVGRYGADPWVLAQARQRVDRWLRGRNHLPPGMITVTVTLAALDGDAALFARLQRALRATGRTQPTRQWALIAGLAGFRHPDLVQRALAATIAPSLPWRQRYTLLAELLTRPEVLPTALAFLTQQRRKLANMTAGRLWLEAPIVLAPLCSDSDFTAARDLSAATGRTGTALARVVERAQRSARVCAHFRAAHAARVAALFR